jgi:hypothetical protein
MANELDSLGADDTADLCEFEEGEGTNLFCSVEGAPAQSRLPKLRGVPKPGTPAAQLKPAQRAAKPGQDIVDLGPAFLAHLKTTAKVESVTLPANQIRPTQVRLSGYRLKLMRQAMKASSYKPEAITVSEEGYIADGHHRWATLVANGAKAVAVERVNQPILKLLKREQEWADSQGLEQPF